MKAIITLLILIFLAGSTDAQTKSITIEGYLKTKIGNKEFRRQIRKDSSHSNTFQGGHTALIYQRFSLEKLTQQLLYPIQAPRLSELI